MLEVDVKLAQAIFTCTKNLGMNLFEVCIKYTF